MWDQRRMACCCLLLLCLCLSSIIPNTKGFYNQGGIATHMGLQSSGDSLCMSGQQSSDSKSAVGRYGEIYYIPGRKESKDPAWKRGKERRLPLVTRFNVLGPTGEDRWSVTEMRYREMFTTLDEGSLFGQVYYSKEYGKMGLVGTLLKLRKVEYLHDGNLMVSVQGVGRFGILDFLSEKSYPCAKVKVFRDYSNDIPLTKSLERELFHELRYSLKLLQIQHPKTNYTMNQNVLKYRSMDYAPPSLEGHMGRSVNFIEDEQDLNRRSLFSFAAFEMLKLEAALKLRLLQYTVLEDRLKKMIKVVSEGSKYLEDELLKQGILSSEKFNANDFKEKLLKDMSDLHSTPKAAWNPSNFVDGEWKMHPISMD